MVNAMMRRRVEDPLERPQFAHQFRVDPKLVDQIHLQVHQELSRWDEQNHRQIKDLFGESLEQNTELDVEAGKTA
jgi:hypothetical protein